MAKKILKGVGSLISGGLLGVAGKTAGSLLGGKKDAAPATPAPAPAVMPLPDDEAAKAARRRAIAAQRQRSGRSSTILTDTSQTLGG